MPLESPHFCPGTLATVAERRRVREDRGHVGPQVGRQLGSREPLHGREFARVDGQRRCADLGPEQMDRVATVIDASAQLSDRRPWGRAEPELLLHLAPRGVDRWLATLDGATGHVPRPPPVGVTDQQHAVFGRHQALDAVLLRTPHEPHHLQNAVREPVSDPADWNRELHPVSVRRLDL